MEDKIVKYYPNEIRYLENRLEYLKLDNEKVIENQEFNKMTINGIDYTDKKEAGIALLNACKTKNSKEDEVIGEYKGFKLELGFDSFSRVFTLTMKNYSNHTIDLGDNALRKYSKNR